jgi:glycosyltransferase involved in cell wall biosynthesis
VTFRGRAGLFFALARATWRSRRLIAITTSIQHSWMASMLATALGRPLTHLHAAHGGAPNDRSYGYKHLLNPLDVTLVAMSDFARQQLVRHGVREAKISVIGNFLTEDYIAACPRRAPFEGAGIRHWVVLSRLDPLKRVDLLIEALERHSELRHGLEFDVLGDGSQRVPLARRAAAAGLPVRFCGFREDAADALARADGLLHLCPIESFGLVVLEAMAAGVPVLVPDQGGTRSTVEHESSGYFFPADDVDGLADRLRRLAHEPAAALNRVVDAAHQRLLERYSETACMREYRRLIGAA